MRHRDPTVMPIDSEIGRTAALISHAKSEKERKDLRKRISELHSKKQKFLKQCGSYQDHRAWEKSMLEVCGMAEGFIDEGEIR